MDGNAAITVGAWSCWADGKDQWWAYEGAEGNGGIVNQLEALLLDRIRDMRVRAVKHVEELAEARNDAHKQVAEAVNSERNAERARCVASIQAMIDAGDPASYCVTVCKATIAAIEEATP